MRTRLEQMAIEFGRKATQNASRPVLPIIAQFADAQAEAFIAGFEAARAMAVAVSSDQSEIYRERLESISGDELSRNQFAYGACLQVAARVERLGTEPAEGDAT